VWQRLLTVCSALFTCLLPAPFMTGQANTWAEAVAALADRTQRMDADLAMQRGGVRRDGVPSLLSTCAR